MNPTVQQLVDLLQVERLEENLFRGVSADIGSIKIDLKKIKEEETKCSA